jgi:unsaturated chondroitin disaccharide hydrolase
VGPREPLNEEDGSRYTQAGLRVLDTLFDESGPYLSQDAHHQGLLLHSVYHWPNGWDHVPAGARVPRGESSQWGDYHAREAALYVKRLAEGGTYLAFYGPGSRL